MDDDQQFCLRWNNHQSTLISVFDTLLENETLVDCTLAAEGKFLKAHKVVLSACSPYFATLLQEQYDKHPIFILKDVKYQELRAMMDYMYRGEVNISQDQLAALLKAAESLQIKGLSDNRSGGGASQPKHPEHHRATMPGKLSGGYTLEQTKRARITGAAGPAMDASEMGSREGSSSPSRRRRKVRRRSIENPMTDVHDNSNSSQQPTQSNAPGLGAITAAASALAAAAAGAPSSAAAAAALASTVVPLSATQQQHQSSTSAVTPAATGSTLSSSKKTDNVKGSTQQHQQQQQDAINTDNVQGSAAGSLATGTPAMDTETATDASTADKSNHKQQLQQQQKASASKDTSSVTGSELVIEPKAEYDDEANDETVEDLTLDEEDMGMDDLDHNAGTSQGGEGSSQGYAPWQHDRSQDELLLATQEAQQRDPQDLSITRIAGLTWNEWNARLAMPLVTQLREGVHPLVFPTDLSMEKGPTVIGTTSSASAGNGVNARDICKIELKSPVKRSNLSSGSPTPPNELSNSEQANAQPGNSSTPLNCSSASEKGDKTNNSNNTSTTLTTTTPTGGKLKHLTQEEATVLMLKAAAEKSAQAANNSGNLSDNSYTDDPTPGNVSGGAGDYHSAFADVGTAGLSINILNSINAMNSLINAGGGNGGLSLTSAAALGVGGGAGGPGGAGNGAGHPCPECGRLYKLKSSLRNHQKWECGKEPQFQCPFCVYRAKQKMHIGRHMERMHKEKFFKVEDLKSFTTATIGSQLAAGGSVAGTTAGGGGGGGGGGGSSVSGDDSSTAVSELRQHFS
ncbi:longitudinals lacking protein, isoforms A/B/D/L isoform X7 [Musca domestica]|uniref:Longitudinals lacking protein, isoforms A/B/D/L isoform X7 n=1 Tax=Musca domestica TaxID=7370 RepID=A0A9J7DFA9_MUSDO|nr:longitudinals lacking protein, isoforms A/B/D/L isoform X7 [Musca domestica]